MYMLDCIATEFLENGDSGIHMHMVGIFGGWSRNELFLTNVPVCSVGKFISLIYSVPN